MQPQLQPISEEEYLQMDDASDVKLEYNEGQVYALAGARFRHNVIKDRLSAALQNRLHSQGCTTVTSDMRLYAGGRYTYPDVILICGEPRFTDAERTLINPTIVAEVTSESTSEHDRSWKLEAYMQIEGLQEYWILDQREPTVTRYIRRGDLWQIEVVRGLEMAIESTGLHLPLSEIFG